MDEVCCPTSTLLTLSILCDTKKYRSNGWFAGSHKGHLDRSCRFCHAYGIYGALARERRVRYTEGKHLCCEGSVLPLYGLTHKRRTLLYATATVSQHDSTFLCAFPRTIFLFFR